MFKIKKKPKNSWFVKTLPCIRLLEHSELRTQHFNDFK